MKRVSLKVAKAIKEAGFPQEHKGYRYTTRKCRGRYVKGLGNNAWYEFDEGELVDGNMYHLFKNSSAYAPTYIDAWLWLWREKKIYIEVVIDKSTNKAYPIINDHTNWIFDSYENPEEAIEQAIEHLIDNDLIK